MNTRIHRAGLVLTTTLACLVALISVPSAANAAVAPAALAPDTIAFRASAQSAANQATQRVTIPAAVRETDGLLMFVTANAASRITATPAGWTRVGARADGDVETVLFAKAAVAADAGRSQAVALTQTSKATVTLLAYDGTAANPVASFASAAEATNRAGHPTPGGNVAAEGGWVVSYWADKSGATTDWTLPAGQTERSQAVGTGTGRVTAIASDQNAIVPIGATPARTATANASSQKATMWTVVLAADPDSAPNVAPVASFTVNCPQMTCTVDGSGSTDTAPGTVASYAWNFGDGSTGTGVTATHTYATTGSKTITLTVTDNQGLASAPTTRTANPTQPPQTPLGHNRFVPDVPRNNTPRISDGEIWDIEVIPSLNRVFIAGSFSSIQNTTGNTTTINVPGIASYNYNTGLIDTNFRPTLSGGGVTAVEATPDGTKLFIAGSFNQVGGVARQKVASLNLTTGAPISTFAFTQSTNNQATALAATNSTLYVGGRFTRVNGVLKTGLAAVNTASGAVDNAFDNNLSGGIGVNGALGVPQLKLTNDLSKLLVVHTGRQIDGQDRYGMGIIDTQTKELLPWRSQLWDTNLARVGGVTRIYAGDIAPDDSYFVVSSGSGGDAPPISDTAIAYPLDAASLTNDDVQPLWISRAFDSIYSVAITEQAVYIGGHFGFIESPQADDPWPGLDNVGYGTGQGLAGYGLGDQVVRREHLAALNPADGKSVEWNSYATTFEGNKAMEATPRGLFVGGDGQFKGGVRTGRVAFYDFNTVTFPAPLPDTTITTPIEGRVIENNVPYDFTGTARVATGNVGRVQVQIRDRDSGQFLQDNGTAFTTFANTNNFLNATLTGTGSTRTWSIPATITTNRNLEVMAQTFPTTGAGDSTKAEKWFESFSTSDQTPTTSISGPSGTLASTSFTMTGTAVDDFGVNRLSYWFRDEQLRYLQNDGSVDSIFNSFNGEPDVIGATNATWSYPVEVPHEGIWRGSATAYDTEGQADLRSATRDWRIDSTAIAPTVTIAQPVEMIPPFAGPTVTVEPGGSMTFSGTAEDDQGLKSVEVSLRNSTTGENLGNDGTWGTNVQQGNYRVSPVNISGTTYNWTYTTPFNLSPGSYTFGVRATDDEDLTTSNNNQGRLTINAQIAGDLAPNGTMTFTAPTDESFVVNLAGAATDDFGVESVRVSLQERDSGRYLQANGSLAATQVFRNATLSAPNTTSTGWSLPAITLPSGGNWRFTAIAFDSRGQQDGSPSTGNYTFYPGDGPPSLSETLGQPVSGTSFSDGKIVVTGRAEDSDDGNGSIAEVNVAIQNAAGQFMSSGGTFSGNPSTNPSWRNAFLNSPGSVGSNYSYTTPVIPPGVYSVYVRAVDLRDQVSDADPVTDGDQPRISSNITVTQPANNPPVPSFTYSCNQNVCTFDGRGSTDENPSSLVYSWNFGSSQGSTLNGSGALPVRTFTAPSPAGAPFQVTLTVRDEWQVSATTLAQSVTIVEPTGNQPPAPTFTASCSGLTCAVNSQGTADPNTGDSVAYSWNWGDGTAASTGASPSAHAYAVQGPYTITLTTTDGWGKSATTTRSVNITEPAGNRPPTATFTASCASFTTCQFNSAGSADPDGDVIRYAWAFGDGGTSTSTTPSRTYATPGTYTVSLTVTDVWGRSSIDTETITITEPGSNNAPTAVAALTSCNTASTTCTLSGSGSTDPDTATGDGIRTYLWTWGDGTADTSTTSSSTNHAFQTAGTYNVTLRVQDRWGRTSNTVNLSVTTTAEPAGNNPPVVVFNQPVCTGLVCQATASGTTDPDGGIRNYTFVWGDGTPNTVTTSNNNQSHTYTAGTYTITLIATDNWGRTSQLQRTVTVN